MTAYTKLLEDTILNIIDDVGYGYSDEMIFNKLLNGSYPAYFTPAEEVCLKWGLSDLIRRYEMQEDDTQ